MRSRIVGLNLAKKALLAITATMAATITATIGMVAPLTIGMLASSQANAQGAGTQPVAFDEISINVSGTAEGQFMMKYRGAVELRALKKTLRELIGFAAGVQPARIIGGPQWLDTVQYDAIGKSAGQLAEGQGRADVYRKMLRTALSEKFAVELREESRLIDSLVLAVDDPAKVRTSIHAGNASTPPGQRQLSLSPKRIHASNVEISFLAFELERRFDRPVMDKTALPGVFDFTIEGAQPLNSVESVAAALKEQLGLRLDAVTAPGIVFVVDSVQPLANASLERSTPNEQRAAIAGYTGERMNMQIVDHDIRDVTTLLEKTSGLRIVVNPKINETVTFKVVDEPWDKALSELVASKGWVMRREEGVIYIDPPQR